MAPPLLSSLLGVGWQRSRWWFKQWIYEHHNLNVAERKEKDSHQTPLTNALANINALLIHPICCLIAFLYTVIWHLLLKSGVRRGEIEERGWRWWGGVVKVSLTLSFHLSLSLFFCDGCKAVDHAPDLSVFLIKILYLQAWEEKKGGKHSVNNQLWEERKREAITDTSTQCDTHTSFKYSTTHWKSLDFITSRLTRRSNPKGLKEATHLCSKVFHELTCATFQASVYRNLKGS